MAISDSYAVAVVGDPGDDEVAVGSGAAYLFARKGSTWSLTKKIIARDATRFDNFGASVAVDNTSGTGVLVVVGAPCNNDQRKDSIRSDRNWRRSNLATGHRTRASRSQAV